MSSVSLPRHSDEGGRGQTSPRTVRHIPGEVGIWLLVFGEMLEFGLFFGVLTYGRLHDRAVFAQSRLALSQTAGLLNTILLLTGSLFVATGAAAARQQRNELAGRMFVGAGACGLGFALIKSLEYGHLFAAGIFPNTNAFFLYYFVFTGFHVVHLAVGMGVLIYMWFKTKKPVLGQTDIRAIESGATFWHLVDLLWVALFPLLYLVS